MKPSSGEAHPSVYKLLHVRPLPREDPPLHDFYTGYLAHLMLTEAARHAVTVRPPPPPTGASHHLAYIEKLCQSDRSMASLGHTSAEPLRHGLTAHVAERAKRLGPLIARAYRHGLRLLHPYTPEYDDRFHRSFTESQPPKYRSPSETEWNYAMTACWALRRAWNLLFFPDDALRMPDRYFGAVNSEIGDIVLKRRSQIASPEHCSTIASMHPKTFMPLRHFSPLRVRAAVRHGSTHDIEMPEGSLIEFAPSDSPEKILFFLSTLPVFRKTAEAGVPVFICELVSIHKTSGTERISLVAFDLGSATFFDPEIGEFEQQDHDTTQLLAFIFRTWVFRFHENDRLSQVAIYPRPPD